MKAWAVGSGTYDYPGGVAYKTWLATGGTVVNYSLGGWDPYGTFGEPINSHCTITYDGTTITGETDGDGFPPGFSGGDGGASGQFRRLSDDESAYLGSAIGGNGQGLASPCNRTKATDVSGLLAAVALAGGKAVEDCGSTPAFGSGGFYSDVDYYESGYGGSSSYYDRPGLPAVVLYFT